MSRFFSLFLVLSLVDAASALAVCGKGGVWEQCYFVISFIVMGAMAAVGGICHYFMVASKKSALPAAEV